MTKEAKPDSKANSSDFFTEPASQPHYRFKEPWTVLALDNIQGFLIQLACAGGSGAIAKTAVAPLERVKVSRACIWLLLAMADALAGPLHLYHSMWR